MKRPIFLARCASDRAIAESLFDDEIDGVALLDVDGNVQRANARFTALTLAARGKPALTALPNAAATALGAALRAAKPASVPSAIDLDGQRRVLRLTLLPVSGRGALLRVSDHTHEQDLEERLGQAERLQAVGELAGGIAHDFNNLLTAIIGAADDLRGRLGGGAANDEDLIQIRQSADRGAALVRHLLAFSRQQTLQPQVVGLNDAVRQTASLLRRLLGAGVSLDLSLEEPGRLVCIDPTQLDQVLTNLAVNARNAMQAGGRLSIATGHRLLLEPEIFGGETLPPGRYASLRVADTGLGIPAEILPRIFEPFFTTRRETGGTGLGLSTVHGIVRQSGGFMAVESRAGEGTCFEILLPRYEDAARWQAEAPAMEPSIPRRPVSRTVLLVDDEAPVRRLAERVLTRAGWNVVAAPSAEDALDLVEGGDLQAALGCVVSDVVMSGMDGPSLVGRLRQGRPDLPAILMSGYADATLRRAMTASDICFLPKPFAMKDLTRALAGATQTEDASGSMQT